MADRAATRDATAQALVALRPRLVALARRVLRQQSEAEDVCDECLARWSRAATLDPPLRNPEAWLTQSVLNLATDRARAAARRHPVDPAALAELAAGEPEPLAAALLWERREFLWRCILDLPERQRDALVLHHMEGRSYQEVAELLDVAESTVRTQAWAARETLRQRMAALS